MSEKISLQAMIIIVLLIIILGVLAWQYCLYVFFPREINIIGNTLNMTVNMQIPMNWT